MKPGSLTITHRNLPHWKFEGAVYWITFRLADSLPQTKLRRWKREREIWCRMHPEPWNSEEWREYNHRFGQRLENWLDAGYGSCALQREEVRDPIVAAVLYDHGIRHRVHDGVVMPNHVHLILEPYTGADLSQILQAIKSVSARKCNRILGLRGRFWMDESYDHIIRSRAQYEFYQEYIRLNPVRAGLSSGQYAWVV